MSRFASYEWQRNGGSLPANGATAIPLLGNNQMVFNPGTLYTLLRTRLQFFGYVIASGSGTGVQLQWWQDVIFNVGVWFDDSAVLPANSPTPITNNNVSPNWVLNSKLDPHLDSFDVASPSESVSWQPHAHDFDVAAERRGNVLSGAGVSVWLAYEVFDPSGIVNTTVAGLKYSLGVNYWLECLFGHA